jgi:nitroimidazol reductase NimA-like FMN-containing flavoprotein (pyridoxamine 5'-phosphate oxidase superfamily)
MEVVHVGFVDDGAPVVLPMIGKMGAYEGNPMAIYIHGMSCRSQLT